VAIEHEGCSVCLEMIWERLMMTDPKVELEVAWEDVKKTPPMEWVSLRAE